MGKLKTSDDVRQETQSLAEAPAQSMNGDTVSRKPGGRTIGRWKVQAHKKCPSGSDEEIAALINEFAAEEGFFDYDCLAASVAKWRDADARQPAHISSPEEEGHAYAVLRQLVFLLGKEGTKKLIDSL